MNIIISTDDLRRSFALNLRGWRTPVSLVLVLATIALITYQGAYGLAQRWAESGDEKVRWMVEEIRNKAEAERILLWNSTVERLDQEVINLQVQLWRLGVLGNTIAERMGMDGEMLIDLGDTPGTSNGVADPADSVDERIGSLGGAVFQLRDHVEKEALRIEEIGSNTSYASMRRATVPIQKPIEGSFWRTSGFGNRKDPFTGKPAFHSGYDFAARTGTPVLAAAAGIVTHRGRLGSYGKAVEIYHGEEISTLYGHLSDYKVEKGEFVNRGQVIALVGSTGRSSGPHLHYEVRRSDRPRPYTRTIKELIASRPEIAALPSPIEL